MNANHEIRCIEMLSRVLRKSKLVHRDSVAVLKNVANQLRSYQKTRKSGERWRYLIDESNPIIFRPTDPATSAIRYKMRIDISGMFSEPEEGIPAFADSIKVRVWCIEKSVWFNQTLDAATLEDAIAYLRGRVMLRFRFDYRGEAAGNEPWFHLQIGGQQENDEYYRMPENLGEPRFLHHPLNLTMVCEYIVRHFFPESYDRFFSDGQTQYIVRRAQEEYLGPFTDRVSEFLATPRPSYLMHMWDAR